MLLPGTWLEPDDPQIPDEVPHGCAVWVEDGRIVIEEDPMVSGDEEEAETSKIRKPRPMGGRMQAALAYIETHPGCTKKEALEAAGVTCRPYGGNPDSVDRLFMRGLIYNLGRSNHYALYVWQEVQNNGRPAGYWAPAGLP